MPSPGYIAPTAKSIGPATSDNRSLYRWKLHWWIMSAELVLRMRNQCAACLGSASLKTCFTSVLPVLRLQFNVPVTNCFFIETDFRNTQIKPLISSTDSLIMPPNSHVLLNLLCRWQTKLFILNQPGKVFLRRVSAVVRQTWLVLT